MGLGLDLTGKTFGGYRIGESLGAGSGGSSLSPLGAVYLAEPTGGGDKVALRIFGIDLSRDKNLASRLVADLQKACAVQHPNLVPVRDIGTTEYKSKRYLYLATERLTGESLKSRIARAGSGSAEPGVPWTETLHIANEVGAALQAIHRAGGTHRHLKAGSIFLARGASDQAETQKVYLLDVGSGLVLANEQQQNAEKDKSKAAKTGKIQDDVRGLAQLVEEMLGGTPSGPGPAKSDGEAAQPVLPLRFRNAKVPVRVDATLRLALADPSGAGKNSRFESVASLVAALFGTGETQPSIGIWSEDGLAKPRPKESTSGNLLWAALVAIVLGALVGYLVYSRDVPPTAASDMASSVQTPVPTPPSPSSDNIPAGAGLTPGQSATPQATPEPNARPGHPGAWPVRPGKIPPLRDADPVPAAAAPAAKPPAAAPAAAAPAAKPPAAAPVPPAAPAAAPAAKPLVPAPAAPAAKPSETASKPTETGSKPPATPVKPPATAQGPGPSATPPQQGPAPGSSGKEEVK